MTLPVSSCCDSTGEQILTETESVCPECLERVPAQRVKVGEVVYLRKRCPQHGHSQTVIWRGARMLENWVQPRILGHPEPAFTAAERGCPYDCGLCEDHLNPACCVLLEVTGRCDLGCPVCFAGAGNQPGIDPDLDTIRGWYGRLLEAGGPFNIQLSGGEPAMRDDLPGIISIGREMGFTFFQLNTNGLRIGREPGYLEKLKEAGLSTVFLQFDGLDDQIYQKIRGRALLVQKQQAIARCAELGIGVVLVPTLIPGVNTHQIGGLIRFALSHHPTVRSVHFQPVSYFGRYPAPQDGNGNDQPEVIGALEAQPVSYFGRYPTAPRDADRITLPEVIGALEAQTDGMVKAEAFKPSGAEHAQCSFHGNFVVMPDGALKAVTQRQPSSCCRPKANGSAKSRAFVARHWQMPQNLVAETSAPAASLQDWDSFLARARTHLFTISGMAFQDAWTLDLERLRECCVITCSPDGRLIPFCAYNLTARDGKPLYRTEG